MPFWHGFVIPWGCQSTARLAPSRLSGPRQRSRSRSSSRSRSFSLLRRSYALSARLAPRPPSAAPRSVKAIGSISFPFPSPCLCLCLCLWPCPCAPFPLPLPCRSRSPISCARKPPAKAPTLLAPRPRSEVENVPSVELGRFRRGGRDWAER